MGLTVLITCCNEQENIADCLESACWADELLVVDSGSTDATLDICERYGCRVLHHAYENPSAQKNWALPHAAHDWVLILDADERVTPELRAEIERIPGTGDRGQGSGDRVEGTGVRADGYWIRRRNFLCGREIRHCGWGKDWVLRLVRKGRARYVREIHESLLVEGRTERCRGTLLHYSYRRVDDFFGRILRYAQANARIAAADRKRVSYLRMLIHPLARFARMYLLNGGILDGTHGLVVCLFGAFYAMAKDATIWEQGTGAREQGTALSAGAQREQ